MKLIHYLKPYWHFVLLAPLFMVAEVVIDLMQPKLMAQIVDQGVLDGNMHVILSTLLHMLLLSIVGGVTGALAAAFASTASQSFGNDLRSDVFRRVMSLSLEQTDRFTTGSLVTRLTNDITAVQDLVAMGLRMFIRALFMFIGGMLMALTLNVHFALVLVCVLPLQFIVVWLLLSKAGPLFSIVQEKLDKVNAIVQENIIGARVVKAFVREDYETARFEKANEALMSTMLKVQKLMATLNPLLMIIMNASVIAIIWIGGYQVEAKTMQVGQVMAAITYVTQILMSIMMVSMMFQSISRARASALRIVEVLNTEPAIAPGSYQAADGGGALSFCDVSFHYPNGSGSFVLQHINLQVEPGENVAILGATGAGKTSLVQLIPRFYEATSGTIYVDGIAVANYDLKSLRSKIAFVLQKSELFSGTIRDNIRWGNEQASQADVELAAQIAQAEEFILKLEQGYDTVIGEKGSSLSGGQKQRLAIARAILKKPTILIFDDSTSALDLGTEAKLQTALRHYLKDTTVITIAQRVASVMQADRIVLLENGTIADTGTHAKLMETSPLYRDIYDSQMRREAKPDE